jgi:nickel transport protein
MQAKIVTAILWAVLGTLLVGPAPGLAHKVNLFAYCEGGVVFVESYFPDGKAVESGRIEVFDSQQKKLLEGTTDKEGKFSFKVPAMDDLIIVLDASMGHRNSFTLKKEELSR